MTASDQVGKTAAEEARLAPDEAAAPDFVVARINLAAAAIAECDGSAAAGMLRQALALAPSADAAWFNLGVAFGQGEEAGVAYGRALVLDPIALDAATNRAQVLATLAPSRAEPALKRGLAVLPAVAPALNVLARLRHNGADNAAAFAWFARAYAADPNNAALHSNRLLHLAYDPALSRETIFERHLDWARRHGNKPPISPRTTPDPGRRLRIGYVSADLARHPVGFFLSSVLAGRDPRAIETICYSDRRGGDTWTRRLQAVADRWVEAAELDDHALAARIQADAVDILVDLSGHTAGNRLTVFAAKPAPLQATWMGYPGTTGLAQVDYLIADAAQVPPGSESWYVERVIRLEKGYVCYAPPEDAPDVGPLPARATGRVTFGSLNNIAKLNPSVFSLWAKVLDAVPGSRLLLAWQSLGDAKVAENIRTMAEASGIAPGRLVLNPGGDPAAFLARYGEIDVALDPFPYSGGLTTVEALWMGVPVLTWPGQRFAGRHAASHLTQVGLTDWIVATPEAYVVRACAAAADLDRLATLRIGLRDRLRASSLLDGQQFTRRLEAAYRAMWRTWCDAQGVS